MSKVRHVYAKPGEYIAVHRSHYTGGYSSGNYSDSYSTRSSSASVSSILARLGVGILIVVAGWGICGIFSLLWSIPICFGLGIGYKAGGSAILCLVFSVAPILQLFGLFHIGAAFFWAMIIAPAASWIACSID